MKPSQSTPENRARVVAEFSAGRGVREIAVEMGLGDKTARRWLLEDVGQAEMDRLRAASLLAKRQAHPKRGSAIEMRSAGLSKKAIARALGVTDTTVGKWLSWPRS